VLEALDSRQEPASIAASCVDRVALFFSFLRSYVHDYIRDIHRPPKQPDTPITLQAPVSETILGRVQSGCMSSTVTVTVSVHGHSLGQHARQLSHNIGSTLSSQLGVPPPQSGPTCICPAPYHTSLPQTLLACITTLQMNLGLPPPYVSQGLL
jgi:hypothetical protein